LKKPNFPPTTFLISAANLKQLPKDEGAEVVFIGRSNAGKSSAINAITGKKGLAKTSKTPGRTQLLNFFTIDEHTRLVDLPGYGYAKVPDEIKERWQKTLSQYLTSRKSLKGLILIMDIRHPLKETDQQMLTWGAHYKLPIHILLTKADKLSRSAALLALKQVHNKLSELDTTVSCQLFSAQSHLGLDEARTHVLQWLK